MNLDNFKAPFIRPEQAWQEADRIRKEHWPSGQIPVEVEEILWKLGIRIDPISSLKTSNDLDAVLSGDEIQLAAIEYNTRVLSLTVN